MKRFKYLDRWNLSPREKIAIGTAAGAVGLFLVMRLAIFPFWDARLRMQRTLSAKTAMFQEMQKLKETYRLFSNRTTAVENQLNGRPKGFTLFSFLEDAAGQSGVKSKIAYMKPTVQPLRDSALKQSMIEMKLESVTLQELVDYLYHLETRGALIFVRRLSLFKSNGSDGYLQAVMQVETIEK